uniref:Uncharacterized protein n=1 Tax=Romanomermis culicivorax TaxID=13658 RepID=A0A915JUM2_ROMCU
MNVLNSLNLTIARITIRADDMPIKVGKKYNAAVIYLPGLVESISSNECITVARKIFGVSDFSGVFLKIDRFFLWIFADLGFFSILFPFFDKFSPENI